MLTLSLDASSIMLTITDAVQAPRFQLNFTGYGQLYYNFGILSAYVYSLFQPLTDSTVFVICRLISLTSTCLTLVIIFLFVRRFLGRIESCFAAGLVAFVPIVALESSDVHPDTLQMMWLTLALFFCACSVAPIPSTVPGSASPARARKDIWFVLAAAAAAGAAFSTKYAGAHILPLIMVAAILVPDVDVDKVRFETAMRWSALLAGMVVVALVLFASVLDSGNIVDAFPEWRSIPGSVLNKIVVLMRIGVASLIFACVALMVAHGRGIALWPYRQWIIKAALIAAIVIVFAAAVAVGSPWSVLYHLRFFPDVLLMADYVKHGHGAQADWFGFHWLETLATGGDVVDPWIVALGALGAAAIVVSLMRKNASRTVVAFAFALAWVLTWTGYLIVRVNMKNGYYMMPMVPGFAVLAAFGLWTVRHALTRWFGTPAGTLGTAAIAAMVAFNFGWHSANGLITMRDDFLPKGLRPENQAIEAWFMRCVPLDTRVFPAPYSYTPPQFPNILLHPPSQIAMNAYKPGIVLLRKLDITTYLGNTDNLSTNVNGTTDDTVQFYTTVTRSGSWRQGPEFGQYLVYATPEMAATIARKGPDCFLSAGYVPNVEKQP